MTGRVHLWGSAVGGAALVAGWHLDLRPVGLVLVAIVGGLFPDIDRATSLLGRWIPEYLGVGGLRLPIFPTVVLSREPYLSGRRIGPTPLVVEHHGLTHSIALALVLSWGLGLLAGPQWGVMLALGIGIHLLLDGDSKLQLFWPLRRWVRLLPGWVGQLVRLLGRALPRSLA